MTVGDLFAPGSPDAAPRGPNQPPEPNGALGSHVAAFLGAVGRAANRRRVYAMSGAAGIVIAAAAAGQIRLNTWQGDFYDALAQRQFDEMLTQLMVFGGLVVVLVALQVGQTWLRETLQIELREAVTADLLDAWLQPRRPYLLGWSGETGRNPDHRIQEDTRRLCELCADLGVGIVQSSLLLVSFVGVLWVLSGNVALVLGDWRLEIPGYMVWCALAYALVGSWASWRIGRPLVALNAEHYAREADFRFALVHTGEASEAIGLSGGEPDARRDVSAALGSALAIRRRVARGLADLTWITAGHGWGALVVPIIAAAPGYFSGLLSFGELMMVAGAFLQVQTSMRWFVENFARIADWRATLHRVMALRLMLPALDPLVDRAGRIEVLPHPAGHLALDALRVELPDKEVVLAEGSLELAPGERVTVTGGPGSGKSMLFRAIAGLWPWGAGRVLLPPAEEMAFLPSRPYLPIGSLRHALCYPTPAERVPDAEMRAAVERVGLSHLLGHLDEVRRWDKELAIDEQQSLAFARLLLRRPKWVVMDDPLNALEEARRVELCGIFDRELAGTAVLAIGRSRAAAPIGSRVMLMVDAPEGKATP